MKLIFLYFILCLSLQTGLTGTPYSKEKKHPLSAFKVYTGLEANQWILPLSSKLSSNISSSQYGYRNGYLELHYTNLNVSLFNKSVPLADLIIYRYSTDFGSQYSRVIREIDSDTILYNNFTQLAAAFQNFTIIPSTRVFGKDPYFYYKNESVVTTLKNETPLRKYTGSNTFISVEPDTTQIFKSDMDILSIGAKELYFGDKSYLGVFRRRFEKPYIAETNTQTLEQYAFDLTAYGIEIGFDLKDSPQRLFYIRNLPLINVTEFILRAGTAVININPSFASDYNSYFVEFELKNQWSIRYKNWLKGDIFLTYTILNYDQFDQSYNDMIFKLGATFTLF